MVIGNEETRLSEVHGQAYLEYCERTPRFFPTFSTFIEPEFYEVCARKFRKDIFDALWFVWLVGLLEVAEGLREIGILPVLLTLP